MTKAAIEFAASHIEEIKEELRKAFVSACMNSDESYWVSADEEKVWTNEYHKFGLDDRRTSTPMKGYAVSIITSPWLNDDDAMDMLSCSAEELTAEKEKYIAENADNFEAKIDEYIQRYLSFPYKN